MIRAIREAPTSRYPTTARCLARASEAGALASSGISVVRRYLPDIENAARSDRKHFEPAILVPLHESAAPGTAPVSTNKPTEFAADLYGAFPVKRLFLGF